MPLPRRGRFVSPEATRVGYAATAILASAGCCGDELRPRYARQYAPERVRRHERRCLVSGSLPVALPRRVACADPSVDDVALRDVPLRTLLRRVARELSLEPPALQPAPGPGGLRFVSLGHNQLSGIRDELDPRRSRPALALTRNEAAAALGVIVDSFERRITR